MNKYLKISSIVSSLLLSTNLYAGDITPSQLDENSSYVNTIDDKLGNTYMVYQDGNTEGKYGKLFKYNGSQWNSIQPAASNRDVINDLEFRQSDLVVDSNNTLHILYINYYVDNNERTLSYQRYNPNSNELNGWESVMTSFHGGLDFTAGLDGDTDNFTPLAGDLAMDINDSNTPIVAYTDLNDNNKTKVRYLDNNGTLGSDANTTAFKDDTWKSLGALNIITSELDMVIDNNIPYIAYKENSGGKVSVIKYKDNTWKIVDANISDAVASNIKLSLQADNNIYLSYVENNKPVSSRLRRFYSLNTNEESNATIASLKVSSENNITYALSGLDKDLFTISNEGNLSFSVAQSYETNEDNNTDGTYELDVTITDNDTNLSSIQSLNISLNDINDAPKITSTDITEATEDSLYSYGLVANDEDGDSINISAVSKPTWLNVNLETNGTTTLTGTPGNSDIGTDDVNLTLNDGNVTAYHNFQIKVKNINHAPLASNINTTILEDANKTFTANDFNFSDPDSNYGDAVESIIVLSVPGTAGNLVLSGTPVIENQEINISSIPNLIFTPEANAFGSPYSSFTYKANDGELNSTSSYTVSIDVTSVDDAPVFTTIITQNKQEDASAFFIDLSASDVENDQISYSVASKDSSKATASLDGDKIEITPEENANGIVSIEVNATSNGLTTTQTFTLNLQSVNDIPTLDTNATDITILEDFGVLNYELNVSDVESDDLNITVIASNPNKVNISKGWSGLLSSSDYKNIPLDLNISTKNNANGIVEITINVADQNDIKTKKFNIDITPVNDAPILKRVPKIVVYKNTKEKNVTLRAFDVENDPINFNATYTNNNLIDNVSFNSNILNISIAENKSGKSDLNITVDDGDLNNSRILNLQVISLQSNDSVKDNANVQMDENETVIVRFEDDNITVKAPSIAEDNGNISHEIDISGIKIKATSEINGSIVEVTDNGVHTMFEDLINHLKAEVNASITGQASHVMEINGSKVRAVSQIIGAQTIMKKDSNGSVQIVTSVNLDENSSVEVVAKQNGTAEHTVSVNGKQSKGSSLIKGASTVVKQTGEVETTAGDVADATDPLYIIKAKVITKANGETITSFVKVNKNDESDETLIGNTLVVDTPYPAGTTSVIEESNGMLYLKTTSSIDEDMKVE